MTPNDSRNSTKIAFVGNYLPRQCGIATFTTDLCETLASEYPLAEFIAVAMNDIREGYEYPGRVRFELIQENLETYEHAAEYLNLRNLDLVCLQHEFGIYGGKAGSHILALARNLKVPLVTTLHTILTHPNAEQRAVMDELIRLSARVVVMSQRAVTFLREIYGVPPEKIDLIPHGIPDVPFAEPDFLKRKFGLEGNKVLLTFGLLSPNKGLEYVLQALPAVLERYPDTVYVALGATHPHVKEDHGESYRDSLKQLARDLQIDQHVKFEDRFVSQEELMDFIGATDIYITPYLNPAQIVSGTLAYTIGAGKQVISTPYWYAEELLAEDRGLIVPFRDSRAISNGILELLGNEAEGQSLRRRAYSYGRNMIWPKVAERYMESFEKARAGRMLEQQADWDRVGAGISSEAWNGDLPSVNLSHLLHMTDSTGILQHAIYNLPNYSEGYCTDDNARALILALTLERLNSDYYMEPQWLTSRYLAFLWYAFNQEEGRFHNFLAYDGRWLDSVGSDDSHGRAIWALGSVLRNATDESLIGVAGRLFEAALPAVLEMKSPRTWAFSLLGIDEYLHRFPGDRIAGQAARRLGERLMRLYSSTQRSGWYWFEDIVSYNNATLPHALLLCAARQSRADMLQAALESLDWLADQQTGLYGQFAPVGSNGFYPYGGEKARFDQQPIEASAMVLACLDAFRITGDHHWHQQARTAFEWFLGRNDLGLPVYDPQTGGCYDGLHMDRLNRNQGAESTLAWLMALTNMYLIQGLTPLKEHARHGYSVLFNRGSSSK
jgi:glycosyltransferase involved in cell wall biosynthesis